MQVRLEVVELRPAVLPLPLEEVFRGCRIGQTLHSSVGHPEFAGYRATAVSFTKHSVDDGVLLACSVGEPVPRRPGRRASVGSRRCGVALGTGHRKWGSQTDTMARNASLGGLTKVAPEMESVCDLHRCWCPGAGAFGEEGGTVAADHFNPGTLSKPSGDGGCFAVRQQIHGPAGFDVNQHSSVDTALAHRVLIDAHHPRGRRLRVRHRIDKPKYRATADGDAEDIREAGSGAAGQSKAHLGQGRTQPVSPLSVTAGQSRDLLNEGLPSAGGVRADEPADLQAQYHTPSRAGQISRKPQVGPMKPVRPPSTARTLSTSRLARDADPDRLAVVLR